MAKERIFNLPETKGTFQLRGAVTGTKKDGFYKQESTKNGKPKREVKFGVKFQEDKSVSVDLQGFVRDEVYFNKRAEKKGEKSSTKKVQWAERNTFAEEGYRLIGVNVGVKKIVTAEGKEVNDKKMLVEFDACDEIGKNLTDDVSVFVRGNIDYSSFQNNNGDTIRRVKLVPNQVSLCADVDFAAEDYVPTHDFTQTIVFMGVDQEVENGKNTGRFVMDAKIVTYSTIEDAQFIITDKSLATIFRKNLKPYNCIKVWGRVDTTIQTEEVKDDNVWGEENAMTKVSAPARRELIITGADKSSLDKEVYTEEKVNEAIMKIKKANDAQNDFGGSNDSDSAWGEPIGGFEDDDDDAWG